MDVYYEQQCLVVEYAVKQTAVGVYQSFGYKRI